MVKLIPKIVVLLIFLGLKGRSQIYRVGEVLACYKEELPHALVGYSSDEDNYYLDINGDQQNDLRFLGYAHNSHVTGSDFIRVHMLNQNTNVRSGRIDSVYSSFNQWWWVTSVAAPLSYGTIINTNTTWNDSSTCGDYLADHSYNTDAVKNVGDWAFTTDRYLGVRYVATSDTIYGWIRLNCGSTLGCYVKDYSFSKANVCGSKPEYSQLTVWPSPADREVYITAPTGTELYLVNILSQKKELISRTNMNGGEFNTSSLPNGVYMILAIAQDQRFSKKFVIQHR